VTFSLTTIFPIQVLLFVALSATTVVGSELTYARPSANCLRSRRGLGFVSRHRAAGSDDERETCFPAAAPPLEDLVCKLAQGVLGFPENALAAPG
jgi:hypothetical protein